MSKPESEGVLAAISKNERYILRHLKLFQLAGLCAALFGAVGILTGFHNVTSRPMAPNESVINRVLIFFSYSIIMFGWLFYIMVRLVEKLKKHFDV
ncbi:MAG TPA: hypothetical protein VEI57_06665 [Nitrospirota bacterium]|nr:hypothetical protein [Nitrospirota bacterium]